MHASSDADTLGAPIAHAPILMVSETTGAGLRVRTIGERQHRCFVRKHPLAAQGRSRCATV